MDDAFFIPQGMHSFAATTHTEGPWASGYQHGGPPAALLARAMEGATDLRVVRVTVELLRPVPVATLRIATEIIRDGARVQLIDATAHAGDTLVCRARGVAVRQTQLDLGPLPPASLPALPKPGECKETTFPFFDDVVGYGGAVEQRFARGDWGRREASLWMRPRFPLVAGEAMSPLQRVVLVADCNNGVANVLDRKRFIFINPDLTVHLFRPPASEWVCLHAVCHPQEVGYGTAESLLLDEDGAIGRSVQTLFIDAVR